MVQRSKRYFGELEEKALLAALEECRRACNDAHAKAPIGGPIYQGTEAVSAAIDNLAEVLTGDRQRFWRKPHGSFSGAA